jgi:hypothetical protein
VELFVQGDRKVYPQNTELREYCVSWYCCGQTFESPCVFKCARWSRLVGVMVSVLAIGPKVHGFKPARGSGFLRTIKFRSTPSFGGEFKWQAPCCKTSQHSKNIISTNRNTSHGQTHYSLRLSLLLATRWLMVGLQEGSYGRLAFPCRYHSTMVLSAHISPGGRTIGPWPQFRDVVSSHRHHHH